MDINKLLQGVNCACGKNHSCNIDYVYIENNAIDRLRNICKKFNNILVVADENTFSAAGKKTVDAIGDKSVSDVIFSGEKVLVPDETAISTVQSKLNDTDLIVGIGSGVIQDLCKYVSFFNKVPYVIVATAPSMDGYASNGAAMITSGMKVTYPAGLPMAIIGDVDVLKNAPMDMIKAGYGDIIGKYSALNDWRLSSLINGEYFCDYIYDLTMHLTEKTVDLADGLLKRDSNSVKALTESLVVIGILMSFAGSSRPASGSEHHLSHFFEITGIVDGTDYLPHGIDVAYSTVVTATLRQKIINSKFPAKIYRQPEKEYTDCMNRIYKSVADGCIELQERVGNYQNDRTGIYTQNENEIKNILAEMPSPKKIEEMLLKVGFNMEYFYSFYGKSKINDAIFYAKDLKDRYTVLWFYYDFFGGVADVQ